MEREDYYRRRALELLAVARAIRDPDSATGSARSHSAINGSRIGWGISNPSSTWPSLRSPDHGRSAVSIF
jgi:hypothetical protein